MPGVARWCSCYPRRVGPALGVGSTLKSALASVPERGANPATSNRASLRGGRRITGLRVRAPAPTAADLAVPRSAGGGRSGGRSGRARLGPCRRAAPPRTRGETPLQPWLRRPWRMANGGRQAKPSSRRLEDDWRECCWVFYQGTGSGGVFWQRVPASSPL